MTTERPQGFSGYHCQQDWTEDPVLTHTDRGTPCGEYLRRYWHPVAMTEEVTDLPLLVKVLGEELVLFKDKSGAFGLLHKHCSHRGASLEFGIVADHGIICCYHGWHYAIDGTLIRAGSEREDGPICKKVIHGAYPVIEKDGLLFAYLGPSELRPPFPVFDTQADYGVEKVPFSLSAPCNWLQIYENTQDPVHVVHLHSNVSGIQFGVASGVDQIIEYQDSPLGMINIQTREVNQFVWNRTVESILPNANQTGAIWEEAQSEKFFQRSSLLRWVVPLDNTSARTIGWRYLSVELDPDHQGNRSQIGKESIDFIGQTATERSHEEAQRYPGDYEAQVSQGAIAIHERENLASSDAGVARLRRLLRQRVTELQAGNEPTPQAQREGETVSTYTQDTVFLACLGTDQQKAFGQAVAKTVINSGDKSPEERVLMVKQTCDTFEGA
ncbi:MAG: aromatic ring-hydroxylating dioxygenase subunit alpha [Candidatus Thioglobus sp.]|nr:MAG: aromatic ring-hydroxylating dioxygenase subunit alpha [Candidatus Thioglobus sp.]